MPNKIAFWQSFCHFITLFSTLQLNVRQINCFYCSPFNLKVRPTCEPEKVVVKNAQEGAIPASIPHVFKIDTNEAGQGDLKVNIIGPDGSPRPVKLVDNGDGTFDATYVPDDCGRYKVDVTYDGKEVEISPFFVQAFATGEVRNHLSNLVYGCHGIVHPDAFRSSTARFFSV